MSFMKDLCDPEFVKHLENVNDNKFDFSKLEKVDGKRRVSFTCPDHGEVSQSFDHMLRVPACPGCYYLKQKADPSVNTPVRVPACLKLRDAKYYQVREETVKEFVDNHTEEISDKKRTLMPYKWNVGAKDA